MIMMNQAMYTSLLARKCTLWIEVNYCKSNLQKLGGIYFKCLRFEIFIAKGSFTNDFKNLFDFY